MGAEAVCCNLNNNMIQTEHSPVLTDRSRSGPNGALYMPFYPATENVVLCTGPACCRVALITAYFRDPNQLSTRVNVPCTQPHTKTDILANMQQYMLTRLEPST